MAITKLAQSSLIEVQEYLALSWTPAVTSAQTLREDGLSLINDSVKKTTTVYYMVDNNNDGTTTLFSQVFSYKTAWKAGTKTKLITNIFSSNDSDAKTKGFYDLEKTLGIDLDGDGLQGSSIYLQSSGTKTLTATDVSPLPESDQYYISLGLAANGKSGTTLNIGDLGKPLIIGALSTGSEESLYSDALMSAYQVGFPSLFAGFGIGKAGIVNVTGADMYFTGGLISSYMIQALNLGSEFSDLVIGGVGSGFGARSSGTLNIKSSDLFLHRNIDSADVTSTDYDVMTAWLSVGLAGATGTTNITEASTLILRGTDNNIGVADEANTKGTLKINNSDVILEGQYSVNDDPFNNDSLACSDMNIGNGLKATGTVTVENNSNLFIDGLSSNLEVGGEGGVGSFTVNNSNYEQIARRTTDPMLRADIPLSLEGYQNSWSGSYFRVGYDSDDGDARTNNTTMGTATFKAASLGIIKGPHAGIEVGGSGTKATGTLNVDNSSIEVVGSGAILMPDATSNTEYDYLAAGINNAGELNPGYFTFVNIGGTSWDDFGGTGTLNLLNNSSMKVFGFDVTSGDTLLDSNAATMTVGGWGTKGSVNVDGGSTLTVGGHVGLGLQSDMSDTNFNKPHGLYNITNYSMVNVKNGQLDAYSYQSQMASQGTNSPNVKYAMYTVLGSQGSLTANQFYFDQNSQILGSGTLNVEDVFSGESMNIHDDVNASSVHSLSNEDANGYLSIYGTEIFVGDTLNFDKLAKTAGYGTLTLQSQVDVEHTASVSITNSKLTFDLSKTASDKLVIKDFDSCTMSNDIFNINGKGLTKNSTYVLIDFQLDEAPDLNGLNLTSIKLAGVKGSLSYDEMNTDLIFTVS